MMPIRHYRYIRDKAKPWKEAVARKMAKNQTHPEQVLWERLKDKQLGVWVYKQKIALGYILDFWCPCAGIAIEVDGPQHKSNKPYDRKRDAVLMAKGIVTMRFPTDSVLNNTAAVVAMIKAKIQQRLR